jgi:hypothetical protein
MFKYQKQWWIIIFFLCHIILWVAVFQTLSYPPIWFGAIVHPKSFPALGAGLFRIVKPVQHLADDFSESKILSSTWREAFRNQKTFPTLGGELFRIRKPSPHLVLEQL